MTAMRSQLQSLQAKPGGHEPRNGIRVGGGQSPRLVAATATGQLQRRLVGLVSDRPQATVLECTDRLQSGPVDAAQCHERMPNSRCCLLGLRRRCAVSQVLCRPNDDRLEDAGAFALPICDEQGESIKSIFGETCLFPDAGRRERNSARAPVGRIGRDLHEPGARSCSGACSPAQRTTPHLVHRHLLRRPDSSCVVTAAWTWPTSWVEHAQRWSAERRRPGMAQTSAVMPSVGVGDDRADSFPDRSVARVDDRAPDQRRNHDAGRDRRVVVKRCGLSRLDQLIERVSDRRRAQ